MAPVVRPRQVPSVPAPSISTLSLPESRINEIAAFLGSCVPDMRYFLDPFMKFGCRNGDFLAAVANSADSEIEEFLKRVVVYASPPQALGLIPEMELWVLKKHLKKYTLAVSNAEVPGL